MRDIRNRRDTKMLVNREHIVKKMDGRRRAGSSKGIYDRQKQQMGDSARIKSLSRQLVIKEQSRTDGLIIPRTSRRSAVQRLAKMKKNMMPVYFEPTFSTLRRGAMANGKYFTTSKRTPTANDYPAPGTYFPDIFKHSSVVKKSFTKTPTFEWGRSRDRFKPVIDDSWKLPPDIYNAHKINCVESILKKRVSLKGPYQLFTGPRDDTTIKNHFAPKRHSIDKLYAPASGLEYLLHDPRKKQCGVIYREYEPALKELRRKVEVDTPGPTTYNITSHKIKAVSPGKVPFNINAGRRSRKEPIAPGPGRYFITLPERRRRGVGDAQSRQLKHLEVGDKIMETAILKKHKEMAKKMKPKREPYIPAHITLGSRYLLRKITQKYIASKSRREWDAESERSATIVRRQPSGWDIVPLVVKNALYQHPAVAQVKMIGHPTQAIAGIPFILVELTQPATEEELLQFVSDYLGDHVKFTARLKILKSYEG